MLEARKNDYLESIVRRFQPSEEGQSGPDYILTPENIKNDKGEVVYDGSKVFKWALENLDGFLLLKEGNYEAPHFVYATKPYRVKSEKPHAAVIKRRPIGGEDTVIFMRDECSDCSFEDIYFEGSNRAAIHTAEDHSGKRRYKNIIFQNCIIDGGYDHASATDTLQPDGSPVNSKWGFLTHLIEGWIIRDCEIRNIKREHAIYTHNSPGLLIVEGCYIHKCGRTAIQHLARPTENGGVPSGSLYFRNNTVRDCTISPDDGYQGGMTLTLAGRALGENFFYGNDVRAGFDESLTHLHLPGKPYNSGAFVSWSPKQDGPNGPVALWGNHFEFHKDAGHSNFVKVVDCSHILLADNFIKSGANPKAVVVNQGNNFPLVPIENIYWKNNDVHGQIWFEGKKIYG